MEPKSYRYNLNSYIWMVIVHVLAIFLIARAISHGKYFESTIWTYVAIAVILLWIYSFNDLIFNYTVPVIQGKSALELDNEKLSYRIRSKLISWDQVKEVRPSPDGLLPMRIILNSGKKVRIRTSEIKGDDNEIFESILAYFEKSKTQRSKP